MKSKDRFLNDSTILVKYRNADDDEKKIITYIEL